MFLWLIFQFIEKTIVKLSFHLCYCLLVSISYFRTIVRDFLLLWVAYVFDNLTWLERCLCSELLSVILEIIPEILWAILKSMDQWSRSLKYLKTLSRIFQIIWLLTLSWHWPFMLLPTFPLFNTIDTVNSIIFLLFWHNLIAFNNNITLF